MEDAHKYDRFLIVKSMLQRNSSPMNKRAILVNAIIKDDFDSIKYLAEEVGLDSIWSSTEKEKIIGLIILLYEIYPEKRGSNIQTSSRDKLKQHDIFRYFLEERGADPDGGAIENYRAQDYKVLPIEMAITLRRDDLVDLLLDYGATVRTEGIIRMINCSPLIDLNNTILIERLFLHSTQEELNNALTELTKFTYVGKFHDVAKLLIDYGADKKCICTELTEIVSSERSQTLVVTRTYLRDYVPVNPRRIYGGGTPIRASTIGY